MQRIEYRTTDKSQWGEGPWQNEPDEVRWTDEDTGYQCVILRGPNEIGHLCGYVGIPGNHPAYGRDYDSVDARVHGGLTYAAGNAPESENDGFYYLGFDCAHLGDLAPGMRSFSRRYGRPDSGIDEVYRDIAYVTSECQKLAKQLKAMEK